ncbi:MAG: DUF4338 domain-containing protein [Anaerolineae bacterium]
MERDYLVVKLRTELEEHLVSLGIELTGTQGELSHIAKDAIRAKHAAQKAEIVEQEAASLAPKLRRLIKDFADGREVDPSKIDPELVPVVASDDTGALFRLATLLWSVPVSKGYGRRMRFLVRDRANGKLIGLLGLKDPVFNLQIRDKVIGWTVDDRRARLVNVMDAYVVGAVPPYSRILGGKLVTSLLGSAETAQFFEEKYSGTTGIISGESKLAKLALITITSALGRSSIYSRLKLPGLVELKRIGETEGWGHFHVPGPIFEDMRLLLAKDDHKYASGHRYGQGPNWKLRVIREALARVGMDPDLLRHGIAREVFIMPLAENWQAYLQGKDEQCIVNRPSADCISTACRKRWIIPRAERFPDFRDWTRADTLELFAAIGLEPPRLSNEWPRLPGI